MSQEPKATETRHPPMEPLVVGFLLLAVVFVFGQTLHHEFINFDDNDYVYQNPHVQRGLTTEAIGWASTADRANNWHPLTWVSHMLDCRIFGLQAGGHHLTSLLLHAANAILLFLLLRRMTGDLWPSAFVAAVFAVHPLRVESVAWVAERKDVSERPVLHAYPRGLSRLCPPSVLVVSLSGRRRVVCRGHHGETDARDDALRAPAFGLLAAGTDRSGHAPLRRLLPDSRIRPMA